MLYASVRVLRFFSDVDCCNAVPSRLPGNCCAPQEKTLTNFPSAFRWFWLSAANALRSVFPKRAEVERSVSPVAELNAEIWEDRLVRDITSHRGGPAADLISSSWLQRREDADLITARLSPSCGALSCVHVFFFFFPISSSAVFCRAQSERSERMCVLLMWVLIRGQRPDLALYPQRVS